MTNRDKDIARIARLMRKLDFCMLTTAGEDGLRSRPMSNNGEVEFDGDVWFFTAADSRKVADVAATPTVQLSFTDLERWLFISMSGEASIVTDVAKKKELWMEELEQWFEDGPESDDVVLLKITPTTVAWWNREEQEEVAL